MSDECRSFKPGDVILGGKYRVEECLGVGAAGEVYRATHIELKVPRAVKVLVRSIWALSSTEFDTERKRFMLEAQLGAFIDHPNVIRVYDFIEEDGVLYVVMEYASGGSLADRIQKVREGGALIPVEDVVWIGMDVAKGLAELHKRDIVHRDVKPSNIFLDKAGKAKIGDLGLVQVRGGVSQRSRSSNAFRHPGTPAYMSPEQRQSDDYLTPPSDIYSLGTVLFEALTGRLLRNVKPGTHVEDLFSKVPIWLNDLVAKMTSDRAEERPWDGEEVAKMLYAGLMRTMEGTREKGSGTIDIVEQSLSGSSEYENERMLSTATKAVESGFRELTSRTTRVREKDGMEMVYVPPGEFFMGSTEEAFNAAVEICMFAGSSKRYCEQWYSREIPQHKVYLEGYWIDKVEVTNEQYLKCVETGVCSEPTYWDDPNFNAPKQPVVGISWYDAAKYCQWAGARLPTEAEWEKAARGTDGRVYPWGDNDPTCELANFGKSVTRCVGRTTPVGSYPAGMSPYGALDMAGNVLEWVSDWFGAKYYRVSALKNPLGPHDGKYKVLRGGSWRYRRGNVRTAYRSRSNPDSRDNCIGFRCVFQLLQG